jgi:hypothetical protein
VTRIRARCPACGEVELSPDDVVLRIVRTEEGVVGEGSTYRFGCPDCSDVISKPADDRIAQLLTTGGVQVEEHGQTRLEVAGAAAVADRPATPAALPPHPESPPAGPALTYDDLLDLHLHLAADGWFEALLAECTRTRRA